MKQVVTLTTSCSQAFLAFSLIGAKLAVAGATLGRNAVLLDYQRHLPASQTAEDYNHNASIPLLAARDDSDSQDTDLSYITKIAAIGDSYSAGIGAGDRLGSFLGALDDSSDYACSRYDHSYPYLVNSDDRLGDPSQRTFQFLSCSGARVQDVLDKQIPNLSGGQQVILLSASGNDANLTDVLNHCVYQWATLSKQKVDLAKFLFADTTEYPWSADWNWDALGYTCDEQLDGTQAIVDSDAFSGKLDSVISAAQGKLADGGMIYYTGYAKFFGESMSSACDTVSWSTWIYKLYDMFQDTAYLDSGRRRRMNSLVDAVNAKIAAAVSRAGPNVQFVEYDSYVGKFHGRFCEDGVDEASPESNTRDDLMFYELRTLDPFGTNPWKRSPTYDHPNATVEGHQSILGRITLGVDPNATLLEAGPPQRLARDDAAQRDLSFPGILPDGIGRVFHPQISLHRLIAERVIWHMTNVQSGNQIQDVLSINTCPYQPSSGAGTLDGGQQIAIASYINPIADPGAWDRLVSYDKGKVSVLVANILNGPDSVVDTHWQDVITRSANSGKTVLGYVRTGYLGVSQQRFQTRLGSTILTDWAAQIEQDVDMWYKLYQNIGGIFFDEGWNDCGPNNIYSDLYAFINANTKRRYPGALTVLNPGATMPECFSNTMDTLMTFESSYEHYTTDYTPNTWTASDSRKIWHIIYNVPSDKVSYVAGLAKQRGAGLVEITNGVMPNPYINLPDESYMQSAITAVEGGTPAIGQNKRGKELAAVGDPGDLSVIDRDYSSVQLYWNQPHGGQAAGYRVYLTGQSTPDTELVTIPGSFTGTTIGGLTPGTAQYQFRIDTLASDVVSAYSQYVSSDTLAFPYGMPIDNMQVDQSNGIVVSADVLVPYAFVRLFLCCAYQRQGTDGKSTESINDCDNQVTAWPIRINVYENVWCPYMIELGTIFHYSGSQLSNGAYTWSWVPESTVPPIQQGYNYKWTFAGTPLAPLGTFIVQGQGYAPIANAFSPCPESYDTIRVIQPYGFCA